MTIALDSEVVASRFAPLEQACYYTIQRNGERWTVRVPLADLNKHKGPNHRQLRRVHVGTALQAAMRGQPDPHRGTKDDPHSPASTQDFANLKSGEWYRNPADGKLYQKP